MRKVALLLLFSLFAAGTRGQVSNPSVIAVPSTPSACNTLPLKVVQNSANLYGSNGSGGCTPIGGGGGSVTFGTTLPSSGTEGETFVGTGNNLFPSGVSAYYHSGAWWLPSAMGQVCLDGTSIFPLPATAEIYYGDLPTYKLGANPCNVAELQVTNQATLEHLTIDLRDVSANLASLNNAVEVDDGGTLLSVAFPNLRNISGANVEVFVGGGSGVTSITLPGLADISGSHAILSLAAGAQTSLSLPSLANISGDGVMLSYTGSSLTSFSLPALTAMSGTGVQIAVEISALTVSNVNALLAQMVSIGASGDTILLDQQTPAAPPTGPVGATNLTIDTGTSTGSSYPDSFTWALDAVCSGTQASGTGTAVAGVPATVTLVVAGVGCPASTNAPTTTGAAGTGLALAFNTADMDTLLGRSWTVTTDVKAW